MGNQQYNHSAIYCNYPVGLNDIIIPLWLFHYNMTIIVIYYSDSIIILMISHVISYYHYNGHYSDHI